MEINFKSIKNVTFITLKNSKGMEVCLSTLGASFYDIKTLDKNNNLESIVLTPTNLEDFYAGYYGKCIGRFSGRIDKAKCQINGVTYELEKNWCKVNSLHGGFDGLSNRNFNYEIKEKENSTDVIFTYFEKENLLPGDVFYTFTYRFMENENEVLLMFEATTTKATHVNLTNHVFFNLSGNGKRDCLNHNLELLCSKYTRLNNELITITIDDVNEVMDFRKMHLIKDYIMDESLQNHKAQGYDHCFIKEDINNSKIAVLQDDESGRRLTVSTSYPAIVFYGGCYPDSFTFGSNAYKIAMYHSTCLECQYVPNCINMDNVDKAILKENEKYSHYIKYTFDLID